MKEIFAFSLIRDKNAKINSRKMCYYPSAKIGLHDKMDSHENYYLLKQLSDVVFFKR